MVEMVLVMVIIATMAAIAVPRYANAHARYQVEAAAGRIIADLSLAQRRAKASGVSQKIEFYADQDSYMLPGVASLDHSARTYAVNLGQEPYRADIVYTSLGGDGAVIFDGYGHPDGGGILVIRVGDQMRGISIDPGSGKAIMLQALELPVGQVEDIAVTLPPEFEL